MNFIKIFTMLFIFFSFSQKSFAEEQHQRQRIKNGVKTGELTKEEAESLRQQHRELRAAKKKMKEDGVFSKEERQKMREMKKAARKKIYKEKHDDEKRPSKNSDEANTVEKTTEEAINEDDEKELDEE